MDTREYRAQILDAWLRSDEADHAMLAFRMVREARGEDDLVPPAEWWQLACARAVEIVMAKRHPSGTWIANEVVQVFSE